MRFSSWSGLVRNAAIAAGVVALHGAALWAAQGDTHTIAPADIVVPVALIAQITEVSAAAPTIAVADSPPEMQPLAEAELSPKPQPETEQGDPPPEPKALAESDRKPKIRPRARPAQHPPRAKPQEHPSAAAASSNSVAAGPAPTPTSAAAPVVLPSASAAYLRNPPPPYPRVSRRLGESGRVIIRVLIGTDGRAQDAHIVHSSGHDRLDQAALSAVRDHWWVFRLIVTTDSGIVTTQSGIVTSDSDDRDHPGVAGRSTTRYGLYFGAISTSHDRVWGRSGPRGQSVACET